MREGLNKIIFLNTYVSTKKKKKKVDEALQTSNHSLVVADTTCSKYRENLNSRQVQCSLH